MLESSFLNNFGSLIVSTSMISGFFVLEKSLIFKEINFTGALILLIGILLYYDRLSESLSKTKKILLPISIFMFYFFYVLSLYSELHSFEKTKYLIYFLIFGLLTTFAWTASDNDLYSEATQFIFLGSLLLSFSLIYLLPKYRRSGQIFDFSLFILILSVFLLVSSSINTPVLKS